MPRTPREAAQAYADCLQAGDFEGLVALHHPDVVCSLLGSSLVSGRYQGRDSFFAHTFAHVLSALAETEESYLKAARVACADERYGILLLHGGLPTRAGGRYDQNYLQLFRVENGLIVENHEFFDTVMLETQVFGKRLKVARQTPEPRLSPALLTRRAAPSVDDHVQDLSARVIAALRAGDLPALLGLLARDAIAQVAGTTPASGIFTGAQAISEALVAAGQRLSPDTVRTSAGPLLVCSDRDGFCITLEIEATLPSGTLYEQIIGIVAYASDGLIDHLHIYFDTAADERLVWDNPLSGSADDSPAPRFSIIPTRRTEPATIPEGSK